VRENNEPANASTERKKLLKAYGADVVLTDPAEGSDGAFFAGQEVCVVGGGDSALDEALILATHASRVTVLHRSRILVAQRAVVDRARACGKIEIIPQAVVEEILGEHAVSAVRWRDRATEVLQTKAARGVFVYIGLEPNTAFLRDVVALDAAGHVETDVMMRTSLAVHRSRKFLTCASMSRSSCRIVVAIAAK